MKETPDRPGAPRCRASEIPNSLRETRPGATSATRRTVALEIEVTRIYAMKGRE